MWMNLNWVHPRWLSSIESALPAYLDLYRAYMHAQESLTIRLSDRSLVLTKHGHDVVHYLETPENKHSGNWGTSGIVRMTGG
jgi:hypothetical protein